MDLTCLNGIITDNLAVYIDISNSKSWNLNTGYTLTSLNQWKSAYSDDVILSDYGLTAYDVGFVNSLTASTTIHQFNRKLTLYRIGENDISGNTSYQNYQLTPVTGQTVGNYFNLNGGYLNGFWKLDGYNYELLPIRYKDGITMETWLNISANTFSSITGGTDGFFLFLGTRAEDKFITASANTPTLTLTSVTASDTSVTDYMNVNEQLHVVTSGQTVFFLTYNPVGDVQIYVNGVAILINGDYTVNGNQVTLINGVPIYYIVTANYLKAVLKNSATISSDSPTVISTNYEDGVYGNVIGFRFNETANIGYRLINSSGITEEQYSSHVVNHTGWTHVGISYKPYIPIIDIADLGCDPIRYGDLIFYINGKQFFRIKNFQESFFFGALNEDKDKQLGVPFTTSWGGGSFGLKNSWFEDPHFLLDPTNKFVDGDGGTFNTNITGITSSYSLSLNTGTTYQGPGSLLVCGNTFSDQVMFKATTPVTLLPNTLYVFTVNVFNPGIFISGNTHGNIAIGLSGLATNVTVLQKIEYKDIKQDGTWISLLYKIQTPYTYITQVLPIYITVNTPSSEVIVPFKLFFDNFVVNKYDFINNVYKKDITKDNLLIQRSFDGSFVGGIQQLRLYDNCLNSAEIYHNFKFDNIRYGISSNQGGRIIFS